MFSLSTLAPVAGCNVPHGRRQSTADHTLAVPGHHVGSILQLHQLTGDQAAVVPRDRCAILPPYTIIYMPFISQSCKLAITQMIRITMAKLFLVLFFLSRSRSQPLALANTAARTTRTTWSRGGRQWRRSSGCSPTPC
jgi:hypothetical protein